MTLQDLQNMIEAAKQQAESGGEVNVMATEFTVMLTNPIFATEILEVDFLPADEGTAGARFVMRVRQLYP